MRLFIGIDPGQTGVLGIIDQDGHYFASRRWDRRDPRQLYILLQSINDLVVLTYLEDVNLPPADGLDNRFSSSSNLLINSGIWQGWLMAVGLPVVLVRPQTWQGHHNLYGWKKKLEGNPGGPTPLLNARRAWPEAPLEFKADDGQAVGLLIAGLALDDAIRGINRLEMQQQAHEKRLKARKRQKELEKKLGCPLPGLAGDAEHGFF